METAEHEAEEAKKSNDVNQKAQADAEKALEEAEKSRDEVSKKYEEAKSTNEGLIKQVDELNTKFNEEKAAWDAMKESVAKTNAEKELKHTEETKAKISAHQEELVKTVRGYNKNLAEWKAKWEAAKLRTSEMEAKAGASKKVADAAVA